MPDIVTQVYLHPHELEQSFASIVTNLDEHGSPAVSITLTPYVTVNCAGTPEEAAVAWRTLYVKVERAIQAYRQATPQPVTPDPRHPAGTGRPELHVVKP